MRLRASSIHRDDVLVVPSYPTVGQIYGDYADITGRGADDVTIALDGVPLNDSNVGRLRDGDQLTVWDKAPDTHTYGGKRGRSPRRARRTPRGVPAGHKPASCRCPICKLHRSKKPRSRSRR